MRLKKARIVVETIEETNRRWRKALSGKIVGSPNEEIISVRSWEILGKVLSSQRLEILSKIAGLKPKSIADLARILKRDFKNVHSDVKFLADIGLIDLVEVGGRGAMVPTAKFSEIDLPLAG